MAKVGDVELHHRTRGHLIEFLNQVNVEGLTFDILSEAANSLLLLWDERSDSRDRIVRRLWDILPSVATWSRDDRLLLSARFLLAFARFTGVPEKEAHQILSALCPLPPGDQVQITDDRPLFLFLWYLFAVWFERCQDFSPTYEALQPAELWPSLADRVLARTQKAGNSRAKIDLLGLAGTLSFLVPSTQPTLRGLKGRIRGVRHLQEATDSMEFVPAFFALQGLNFLCPRGKGKPQNR